MRAPFAQHTFSLPGVIFATALYCHPTSANAQTSSFVAPPRTISDIAAILDNERPKVSQIEATKTLAGVNLPIDVNGVELARLLSRRAIARWDLGRFKEAVADCEEAIRLAREASADPYEQQVLLLRLYQGSGVPQRTLAVLDDMVRDNQTPQKRTRLIAIYRLRVISSLSLGRIHDAETFLHAAESILADAKSNAVPLPPSANWVVEDARARVLAARGDYASAALSFQKAQIFVSALIQGGASTPVTTDAPIPSCRPSASQPPSFSGFNQ